MEGEFNHPPLFNTLIYLRGKPMIESPLMEPEEFEQLLKEDIAACYDEYVKAYYALDKMVEAYLEEIVQ